MLAFLIEFHFDRIFPYIGSKMTAEIGDLLMNNFVRRWLLLAASVTSATLLASNSNAMAQAPKNPPANAEAVRYGSGWECKHGYQRQEDSCLEVKVPNHAFLTNTIYGKGWECSYGFVEDGDRCVAVKVPANASIDSYFGNGWQCLSGYRKSDAGCEFITVPDHAFLSQTATWRGWECERGYHATEAACIKIEVPSHAFLIEAGDDWRCERGYEIKNNACSVVHVPDHATYVAEQFGKKWKCIRGFEERGAECAQIKIPANAHLASSGNSRECNRPYRLLGKECAKE
jgi:hypothetical protein